MNRRRPAILWVALVTVGVISLAQLGASSGTQSVIVLVSAVLSAFLLIGLHAGHRWAYVLTLLFCVVGPIAGFDEGPEAGWQILIVIWLMVAVPVILSSRFFWVQPRRDELPDPLRCPKCGYSLLGLTEPRCPECGQEFKMPG